MCVSVKEHPTARFGYYVDPEFFIYQSRDNRTVLELAQRVFGTGRIRPKPGNDKVLVFSIENRRSLAEKVVPFLRRYMTFAGKKEDYERFCSLVEAMERREHHTPQGMARIVEQAYALNPGGKGRTRKRVLREITDRILRDYTPDSRQDREKV